MVKIPGTAEGIPAIRQCLSEGININITLLFGVPRYREVMDAYLSALEDRLKQGEPIGRIRSVASFFVSRVDTNVDPKLDALTAKGNAAAKPLRAKLAIANARVAYEAFEEVFGGAAVRGPEGEGRARPAAALGVDVHQGQDAPRPLLRRGAHRSRLGRYRSAGDLRRLSGPWGPEGPHP